MCVCKMIGGCVDGMDYELPDGHDGCVVIERAPGHLNEPVKYHSYRIVEMFDGSHVGVCEAISLEKPQSADRSPQSGFRFLTTEGTKKNGGKRNEKERHC